MFVEFYRNNLCACSKSVVASYPKCIHVEMSPSLERAFWKWASVFTKFYMKQYTYSRMLSFGRVERDEVVEDDGTDLSRWPRWRPGGSRRRGRWWAARGRGAGGRGGRRGRHGRPGRGARRGRRGRPVRAARAAATRRPPGAARAPPAPASVARPATPADLPPHNNLETRPDPEMYSCRASSSHFNLPLHLPKIF